MIKYEKKCQELTKGSEQSKSSPAKKELHDKLALLNSRYVSRGGEKQEKGLAGLEDLASRQEADLFSEDTTPTNDVGFLRYDPTTNRLTLEHDNKMTSPQQ